MLPADALADDVRKLQLSQQQARALAEKGAPQDSGCSSACEDFDDEDRIRKCYSTGLIEPAITVKILRGSAHAHRLQHNTLKETDLWSIASASFVSCVWPPTVARPSLCRSRVGCAPSQAAAAGDARPALPAAVGHLHPGGLHPPHAHAPCPPPLQVCRLQGK